MTKKLDYQRKLGIVEGAAKEALLNVKKDYDLHLKKGELAEINNKRFQYYHCIFGYDIVFEEEYGLPKVEEYNDTIIQIYIAPYRITKKDVEDAVESNCEEHPFNEESIKNPEFIDYDKDSGNFHKKTDDDGNFEYQIVLITEVKTPKGKRKGPGFKPEFNNEEFQKNQSFEYRKDFIKTKYYFPRIDDEKKDYSIEELLRQALDFLGSQKKEKPE